jgi:hypothetical protein
MRILKTVVIGSMKEIIAFKSRRQRLGRITRFGLERPRRRATVETLARILL